MLNAQGLIQEGPQGLGFFGLVFPSVSVQAHGAPAKRRKAIGRPVDLPTGFSGWFFSGFFNGVSMV